MENRKIIKNKNFIKTFWIFTDKAIKQNKKYKLFNKIFAVVDVIDPKNNDNIVINLASKNLKNKPYLLAIELFWDMQNKILIHPFYGNIKYKDLLNYDLFKNKNKYFSSSTVFYHDSYYMMVNNINEAISIIENRQHLN